MKWTRKNAAQGEDGKRSPEPPGEAGGGPADGDAHADARRAPEPGAEDGSAEIGAGAQAAASGAGSEEAAPAAQPPKTGAAAGESVAAETLEAARAERDSLRDAAQRAQAELLNFQARMRRERELDRRFRNESLLRDLMPVLDNFDRAIGSAKVTPDSAAIVEGLQLVQREVFRVLESHGVKPFDCVGLPYDPATMEVIDTVAREDVPDKQVVETLRRGFLYHDRVLQAARVRIAVHPQIPEAGAP